MDEPTGAPADSGYVFEVHEDKSVSFRRADMDDAAAKEALLVFLHLWFRAELRAADIHRILSDSPQDWPFIKVRGKTDGSEVDIVIGRADREPGKNSGENAVIRNIGVFWKD